MTSQRALFDALKSGEAIHDWHLQVHENQVVPRFLGHFEPLQTVGSRRNVFVPEHFEDTAANQDIGRVIVDQQDTERSILRYQNKPPTKRASDVNFTCASFLLIFSPEFRFRPCILGRSGVSASPAGIRAL